MKTIEINVWVHNSTVEKGEPYQAGSKIFPDYVEVDKTAWTKAKLIIEIPEKRVLISETQFDEIFRNYDHQVYSLNHVKEKLFAGVIK